MFIDFGVLGSLFYVCSSFSMQQEALMRAKPTRRKLREHVGALSIDPTPTLD